MRASRSCSSSAPPDASARLLQRRRIDAIALAGGRRPVLEDVPEMSAAAAAMHLDPLHPVARIAIRSHRARIPRPREARPAAAALELFLGAEELRSAARAEIPSRLVVVPQGAGEGALGAFLPQDPVLLGRQLAAPFFVCHMLRAARSARRRRSRLLRLPDLVAHPV